MKVTKKTNCRMVHDTNLRADAWGLNPHSVCTLLVLLEKCYYLEQVELWTVQRVVHWFCLACRVSIYIYISDSLSLCGKPNQIGQTGLGLKTMSHAVQWASLDQPSMLLLYIYVKTVFSTSQGLRWVALVSLESLWNLPSSASTFV